MRKRRSENGLTVNVIAGSHVVFLGFDLAPKQRKGCLGFAISREDHTEDERYWLSGTKTFQATDPGLGPGGQVSTRRHPIQSFQWADYSAKPAHDYTYRVVPLYGTPTTPRAGDDVSVRVTTESESGHKHSVFFNRGAPASQEYARRFLNQNPEDVGEPAYRWLSRGLLEALEAFVARAKDGTFGLHAAIYEFQWPNALQAFKAAKDRGADVRVIYDGIPGDGPLAKNEAAIAALNLASFCRPRTRGQIMHDKFVVLTKNGKPIAVWTGSTNLTENGIFGHLNCGHLVEDAGVAAAYLAYWSQMSGDPELASERIWMAAQNPNPPAAAEEQLHAPVRPVFSPRKGLSVLDWYGQIAGGAQKGLFMTFAFGMHKSFKEVYEQRDGVLRFALMEKEGNGSGLAQGKIDIARIRRLANVIVAIGNNIVTNSFDRWLKERRQLTAEANVRYIHTKFMLVDPLSDHPVVITGSANFSEASTSGNDENMLVIRDDLRVADIYFGEFMRLFSHYAFREAVAIARDNGETDWQPAYLQPTDAWQVDHFTSGHSRFFRRGYFAGNT